MSLILDALRKSERTRQQTLTGRLSATDAAHGHARVPVPWATLIGILLVANALVLTVIFWRAHTGSAVPAVATVHTPVSNIPVASASVYRPQIRSLAAEAAVDSAAKPAVSSIMSTPQVTSPGSMAETSTQTATAPTTSLTAPAKHGPGVVTDNRNIPAFDTLPLAFQQSLPRMHMDVHSYARNPADRFVVINMQRYQEGDTLKEGPKVIAITPQGVVLEYGGQKFLLPRL